MRRYMILAVLVLCGCANVHETAWNGDKIKLCGSRWAGQDDFDKAASKQCSQYKALSGGVEETGDYTVSNSWNQTNINSKKTQCVIYQCMK